MSSNKSEIIVIAFTYQLGRYSTSLEILLFSITVFCASVQKLQFVGHFKHDTKHQKYVTKIYCQSFALRIGNIQVQDCIFFSISELIVN